ncbi:MULTISPECIES: hypothetical protein [unclassified Sphingomonas]|uniref:hypothetical protein n=1 Tax=unclassified Sphingomonas TaxID=196159 RepID=UPI0012E2ADE5|nr:MULTISPECIES: hypothetical protein [unclassified Sphingomonas]
MVSREELYRLVWSEPMTRLAKRFEVSDSYLARICKLLNVPRPGLGYWAKMEVGKAPPQTPLPPAQPGDALEWTKEGMAPRVPRQKPVAPAKRAPEKKIRIARTAIHGLIRGARGHLEHSRPIDDGAYLKPYKKLTVDVLSSKTGVEKALELANDLFNAFDSIGHRAVIAPNDSEFRRGLVEEREVPSKPRDRWEYSGLWSPWRPTVVFIGTVAIGLAVIEMSANTVLRYVNGKYIPDADYVPPRRSYYEDRTWTTNRDLPSGRMRIVAYSPYARVDWKKHWDETKTASLRPKVKSIVEEIEAFAPEMVARLEEADRQAELRRQEYERQEDIRRRDEDRRRIFQSIKDSRSDLDTVIERWTELIGIERFLAGVEARAATLPDGEREAVTERLALARDFLGSQDPLDFIRRWQTPRERYSPRFSENEGITELPEEKPAPRSFYG